MPSQPRPTMRRPNNISAKRQAVSPSSRSLLEKQQMVRSIDPQRAAIRGAQRYSSTAAVFGTRVVETISFGGQGRLHDLAVHMAERGALQTLRRLLQARGRPHM